MTNEELSIFSLHTPSEISSALSTIPDMRERLERRVNIEEYVEKLNAHAYNFGIMDGRHIVAIASMYANDYRSKTAYITMIACEKESRRKGYGGALLEYLINFAVGKGMAKVALEVETDNQEAARFYFEKGFQKGNQTECGYLMEKSIEKRSRLDYV